MQRISRLGMVNAYLVAEDDGLTLIDTLLPRSAKPVLGAAQRLGSPIRRIALTHAHGDHIGSRATGSARSRSSPRPATRPGTSPSSTTATAPCTAATPSRPSAA